MLLAFIFKLGVHATGYYTVCVSHDLKSRLTSVLLLTQTYYHDVGGITEMLRFRRYRRLSLQPMLVPFMVATSISGIHALKINRSNQRLNHMEEKLGQHTYDERPSGDPLETDFVWATTQLNSNSFSLGVNESRLDTLVFALQKMHEYNSKIVSLSERSDVLQGIPDLDDMIEHLLNYASNLRFRNSSEQKRTQTHLAVVFNFMAQKDNLVNISLANDSRRIAAASKRDSTAMKTIAVVTMFFLPGTYIAALFAIPVFNWDAGPNVSVLNYRFWYYWATTLPLTAVVLLIWVFWEPVTHVIWAIYDRVVAKKRSFSVPEEQSDQRSAKPKQR